MTPFKLVLVNALNDKFFIRFYFNHMESLKLGGEIIEHKARNESLVESQVTISHEFKTPLTSSLMLLETLLNNFELAPGAKEVVWLIIS